MEEDGREGEAITCGTFSEYSYGSVRAGALHNITLPFLFSLLEVGWVR